MPRVSLINRMQNAVRAFGSARGGNVMMIFALALVPIVGLVGSAVDYSRANSVKADMQAALDSTALMLSKNVDTLSAKDLQQAANDYFNALFNRPGTSNIEVTPSYDKQGSSLTVAGSASINADFLGVVGINRIDISSSSTVAWGMTKLRVVLVLDNTGSMLEGVPTKIDALKVASHQLLAQLKASAKNPNDVQVAIVPFTTAVNVGAKNYDQPWIDWTDWDSGNQVCVRGICTTPDHKTWNGCVIDRDQSYDVQNTSPNPSNPSTLFPAEQTAPCPVPLMALSNDWIALNAMIDTMVAGGMTNQAIGLAWGWQALTQGQPMNAPGLPAKTQQIIILLTDGMNTRNRWTTSQTQIDRRTAAACNNIKAANITIYTVLVMSGNSSILQQCASDPGKYFAVTSSGQIISTFSEIGSKLSQLRIAK